MPPPCASLPPANGVFEISATFLELLGKHATDLIAPPEADATDAPVRPEVAIHQDKVSDVHPRLISTPVCSLALVFCRRLSTGSSRMVCTCTQRVTSAILVTDVMRIS